MYPGGIRAAFKPDRREKVSTMAPAQARRPRNARIIETIQEAEKTSLEAVRRFLDTVDEAFPHLSDDKPRRKIIDSAFEMTEHLVGTATSFAQNIVEVTQSAVAESERSQRRRRRRLRPRRPSQPRRPRLRSGLHRDGRAGTAAAARRIGVDAPSFFSDAVVVVRHRSGHEGGE